MHIYTNRIILLLQLSHPLCSFQQVRWAIPSDNFKACDWSVVTEQTLEFKQPTCLNLNTPNSSVDQPSYIKNSSSLGKNISESFFR